jgi:hypothetical protein
MTAVTLKASTIAVAHSTAGAAALRSASVAKATAATTGQAGLEEGDRHKKAVAEVNPNAGTVHPDA